MLNSKKAFFHVNVAEVIGAVGGIVTTAWGLKKLADACSEPLSDEERIEAKRKKEEESIVRYIKLRLLERIKEVF